jgi:hypothetical protein
MWDETAGAPQANPLYELEVHFVVEESFTLSSTSFCVTPFTNIVPGWTGGLPPYSPGPYTVFSADTYAFCDVSRVDASTNPTQTYSYRVGWNNDLQFECFNVSPVLFFLAGNITSTISRNGVIPCVALSLSLSGWLLNHGLTLQVLSSL